MDERIGLLKLGKDDSIHICSLGVIIKRFGVDKDDINYHQQEIDMYINGYRGTLEKGSLWGPGILTYQSIKTLKFVIK